MNRISQLAIVLVVVGALVLAGPAFGFTTIAADRMVDVATTDTEDALLGVSDTDQTPNQQNDAVVMTITNNAGVDFDSLETDVELEDDNDALAISDDFADQLEADEETGLELTCEGGGDGVATVSVTATGSGSGLEVSDVTEEYTFSYSCTGQDDPGGGFSSAESGDVVGPGPTTQTVAFELDERLDNSETVEITIDATEPGWFMGADYTDATASITEPQGTNDDIEVIEQGDDEITLEYQVQGNLGSDEAVIIEVDGVETEPGFWFDFGFGSAEFTRSDSGESVIDDFLITEDEGDANSMGAMDSGDGDDEPVTVTEDELEEIDIDDLEEYDTQEELIADLEDRDDVEIVEDE